MDDDEYDYEEDKYEVRHWRGDTVEEDNERWRRWRRNTSDWDTRGFCVRRAIELEPDLLKVFELARLSQRVKGYNRSRRYEELKQLTQLLVGGLSPIYQLREGAYYDAVLVAMEGLLPDDLAFDPELFIYPGEDVVATILATRPILPLSRPISVEDYLDPESEVHAEIKAQRESDLAWLHNLKLRPHRELMPRE